MKTKLITLLALSWIWLASATPADVYITAGRNYLTTQDVWNANLQFTSAVQASPTNEEANTLAAVTRLLVLPQQPAGSNFLNQLGVAKTNRDLYNWTAMLPVDINGSTIFPAGYNSATAIAFFRTNIMAALAASATNLANIKDTSFTLTLLSSETTHAEDVTLDYGDVQLLRALVAAGQFAGYTINAQNASVVIPTLQKMSQTNGLTLQALLAAYPSLLTLSSAADLTASKGALTNAIALYFAASDFIRNVRAPGAVRLFNLGANEVDKEAQFRTGLTNVLLSLNGPVQFDPLQAFSINASNYFSGAKTLRSLTPQFTGDTYVNDSAPDYTFGGILQNEPAYLTEEMLRKSFYSYAGIYGGQVYDFNYGDPNAGNFAVFVGANQQATVVGYDADAVNSDAYTQSGGIFVQFTIDKGGNWQFENSNVSGNGWAGKDGSFGGELDYTNGDSVQLYNGQQLSPLGPFQNAAGYYNGAFSGAIGSGTVSAVLSAGGDLIFREMDSSGLHSDGGEAQLDSNNHFSTVSVGGATLSGTLNPSTFQFTVTVTAEGGGVGNVSMTRSAKVSFDTPPVITANLPSVKTATLGTNVTLSFVASGSPPMSYQWYDNNDVLIPFTITNTLTITNVQYGNAGTYSVTINNVAGETNAAVTLTVVRETTPPTNQITAPTPGLQVSNANYTITGKAGDNVAVSNVWVQLNNGGWNPATSFNGSNWTAQVTLMTPGPNTVQAYAVDTSGNVSTTNTVNFNYVVSAILMVQLTGKGTVSPNYSNSWLEIGRNYSMKATPATGFAVTNWTISTNWIGGRITNNATVQFMMAPNLTLQINFADVTRPTNTITTPMSGQKMTNALATVIGTAKDNWKVAGVWYQLNSGAWNLVTTTNSYTNWTQTVTLLTGTNTLKAYALDLGGNFSTTNTLSVVSSNAFKLQLAFTNALPMKTNGLVFSLQLSTGLNGHIQVSTNLTSWVTLTNFVGTNSTITFRDPAATNSSRRFYRAVVP